MHGTTIGIDFGADGCVTAALRSVGETKVITSAEGGCVVPSVVAFDAAGNTYVGDSALAATAAGRARDVRDVRRHLGEASWTMAIDGVSYSAVDVATVFLAKIARDAVDALGPIDGAVITVPAHFRDGRRDAIAAAAAGAGLPVLRLMNEPVAAAVAGATEGRVLVYALGVTMFDVTVLEAASGAPWCILAATGAECGAGQGLDACLDRTMRLVRRTVDMAELTLSDLDAIVPAGCAARDPRVFAWMQQQFGRTLRPGVDPGEVIARGAARYAAQCITGTGRAA